VSFMLTVKPKPIILGVVMLSVVIRSNVILGKVLLIVVNADCKT
jgi:hypothetical protein